MPTINESRRLKVRDASKFIENQPLQYLCRHIFDVLRLAADKAVLHHADPSQFPLADDEKAAERIFLTFFKSLRLPPERKEAVVQAALKRSNVPPEVRRRAYGGLNVDFKSQIPVEKQVVASTTRIDQTIVKEAKPIHASWTAVLGPRSPLEGRGFQLERGAWPSEPATTPTPPLVQKVSLKIWNVFCEHETEGFFFDPTAGQDEISLGGTSIDCSGNVEKVAPEHVADYDSGDQHFYNPPKDFFTISIPRDNVWPKMFFATLVLAEVDMGGICEFVNNLAEKVQAKVTEALADAATQAAIVAAGAAIGGLVGNVIGALVGAAVGYVVGLVFEQLRSAWSDEIFEPRTVQVWVESPDFRFLDGSLYGGPQWLQFEGFGGRYHLIYEWWLQT